MPSLVSPADLFLKLSLSHVFFVFFVFLVHKEDLITTERFLPQLCDL